MEDTKGMIVHLNHENAMFVERKDILRNFVDQKVLAIIEESTQLRNRKKKIFNGYKLPPGDKQEPYRVNVVINSMEITMEIDAGASVSIINYNRYESL